MPIVIYLARLAINLCAGVDIGLISFTNSFLCAPEKKFSRL
jgi:hypothetical protein